MILKAVSSGIVDSIYCRKPKTYLRNGYPIPAVLWFNLAGLRPRVRSEILTGYAHND